MLGAIKENGLRIVGPALLRRAIDIERFRDAVNRTREGCEHIVAVVTSFVFNPTAYGCVVAIGLGKAD